MTDGQAAGTQTIPARVFSDGLVEVLRELFEEVPRPSMMLDAGDAWFQTLGTVTAEEASIPAADGISNIAASTNHAAYYVGVTLAFVRGEQPETDWDGSWAVGAVDAAGWDRLRGQLRSSYDELMVAARDTGAWAHPDAVTGAIATAAHCAYHLGEVRRTLGVIRAGGGVRP
jgi:hypothetical protein